jgi:nicotinate-nucleotide adenylyltransferase
LQREQPGAQLVLLMGEDQATPFTSWHAWEDIARTAIVL